MTLIDNTRYAPAHITLGALLEKLGQVALRPLVFEYDGKAVRPGYHVTEVKAGRFSALDCGANPEAWSEIFVQLWDVDDGDRTHMTAGKFSVIVRKVSEHVAIDGAAKLTFEVSDGVKPMQLYCAGDPLSATTPFSFTCHRALRAANRAIDGSPHKPPRHKRVLKA